MNRTTATYEAVRKFNTATKRLSIAFNDRCYANEYGTQYDLDRANERYENASKMQQAYYMLIIEAAQVGGK